MVNEPKKTRGEILYPSKGLLTFTIISLENKRLSIKLSEHKNIIAMVTNIVLLD